MATKRRWGVLCIFLLHACAVAQRRLGAFREVFAWKQLTYDIDGDALFQNRYGSDTGANGDPWSFSYDYKWDEENFNQGPGQDFNGATSTARPVDEKDRFFVQYNNVPIGAERVGDRLFVTVPRRRYGIPSTLNYIDLTDSDNRSPALKPYPDFLQSKSLTSVYRTRADNCGRLWMVDTGLLEIPGNPQQVQAPSIVVYDVKNDRQILKYTFKATDIPAANTPAGLASITVDTSEGCANAFAYIPDLATYGLIVYSLRENDSWRLAHNYFYLNPTAGNLNVAGHRFQWNDGIFSITLTDPSSDGCRTAYFHPLISIEEFAVSTCVLKNKTASEDRNFFKTFSEVGYRGGGSQSTMHDLHGRSRAIFFAEAGRDAVSCWNSARPLAPSNVLLLAQDRQRLSYPSDLHVTDDEVWVMANSMPRFAYSRLDINEYNFFIYSGNVKELIRGTICDSVFTNYKK